MNPWYFERATTRTRFALEKRFMQSDRQSERGALYLRSRFFLRHLRKDRARHGAPSKLLN